MVVFHLEVIKPIKRSYLFAGLLHLRPRVRGQVAILGQGDTDRADRHPRRTRQGAADVDVGQQGRYLDFDFIYIELPTK